MNMPKVEKIVLHSFFGFFHWNNIREFLFKTMPLCYFFVYTIQIFCIFFK